MYAIIRSGGKQYKVEQGSIIHVEKLPAEVESSVNFEVVAVSDGKKLSVGSPLITGAEVLGKVLKTGKGKKITVFTYKPKKGQKRKLGHRQPYTRVEITEIKGT